MEGTSVSVKIVFLVTTLEPIALVVPADQWNDVIIGECSTLTKYCYVYKIWVNNLMDLF